MVSVGQGGVRCVSQRCNILVPRCRAAVPSTEAMQNSRNKPMKTPTALKQTRFSTLTAVRLAGPCSDDTGWEMLMVAGTEEPSTARGLWDRLLSIEDG